MTVLHMQLVQSSQLVFTQSTLYHRPVVGVTGLYSLWVIENIMLARTERR